MTTTQNIIAQTGQAAVDYLLEFRTWNGAAYVWTDYTDRLVSFSGIGSTVEQNAFPNAFRMSTGSIEVDNTDGMFDDLDVLDGKLYNAAEPYGKSIYKRMVRITDVRDNETKVIGVALVRDVKPSSAKRTVIIETISLDARAADQGCDQVTAERHPLGGTTKAASATWTMSNPASATANVNMYRWRQEETEGGEVSYGWFKDRHYADVIERTAWALDDLATNITKTYRLMTSDNREIATTRNIPPDDPAVSVGVTPDRCRAVIWNPVRNVLVCCVGHLIYDYDPVTNTYTLRNTLTAGRDVQRAFYLDKADAGGHASRIVLVQCDMVAYAALPDGGRTASAWCTVLDATGTGAYALLANEKSLGTDVFPGTHSVREGYFDSPTNEAWVGAPVTLATVGENMFIPFKSKAHSVATTAGVRRLKSDAAGTIFENMDSFPLMVSPQTIERSYLSARNIGVTAANMGLMSANGGPFAAAVNWYAAGGGLYFFWWDSVSKYGMRSLNLSDYVTLTNTVLGGANTHVPHAIYCHKHANVDEFILVAQTEWKDLSTYSIDRFYRYDLSVPAWTQYTFLSGATGSDQAWTIMEFSSWEISAGSYGTGAILFNRETAKFRFCMSVPNSLWTTTDSVCQVFNGKKDQDNRLEGLFANTNTSPDRLFFVEAGVNKLWYWDGTNMVEANKTPAGAASGDPVNSDRGLGSMMTASGVNYPDTATPNGVMFWISANDYGDVGSDHPAGRYVLCQYANFDPGFIELLDVSGLSFWQLRTLLAERVGFVHYYAPDGTMTFKPRTTSGTEAFSFSSDNRNLIKGDIQTRGFEAIVNDITVRPYAAQSQSRVSDIVRGYNEAAKDGTIDFPENGASVVAGDPGENSQWKVLFVTATTYDLYKLQGLNYSATVPKTTAPQSINSTLRAPADGAYLTIAPDAFSGVFVAGDNFTFWALQPQESLSQLGDADRVVASDAVSIAAYKRVKKPFDNRFVRKQLATDYANNILTWRKLRHDVLSVDVVSDPNYLPLLRCTLTDENMGYGPGNLFQIMGVQHRMRQPSNLVLVKV